MYFYERLTNIKQRYKLKALANIKQRNKLKALGQPATVQSGDDCICYVYVT
jgi:hypothetical protein